MKIIILSLYVTARVILSPSNLKLRFQLYWIKFGTEVLEIKRIYYQSKYEIMKLELRKKQS